VCLPGASRGALVLPSPGTPYAMCLHVLLTHSAGQSRDVCPLLYLLVLCKEPMFFWRVKTWRRKKQLCNRLAVGEKHFQEHASPAGPCPKDSDLWKEPCPACMAGARFPPVAESCHSRNQQLAAMLCKACKEQASRPKTTSPTTGMEITSHLLPNDANALQESMPNCCAQ